MNQPISLAQAKAHFRRHTRRVLSDDARQAMKCGMQWFEGNPIKVVLGGSYTLQFHRNGYQQNIYCTADKHFVKD